MRSTVWGVFLLAGLLVGVASSTAAADPPLDYILHCRGCHGPTGRGAPGAVPSFHQQLAKFLRVPGGREYLIRVPGTSQSELSDARVAVLLNWMLHEFSPHEIPADFTPFTEAEVTRHRRPPLLEVRRIRRALVQAMEKPES